MFCLSSVHNQQHKDHKHKKKSKKQKKSSSSHRSRDDDDASSGSDDDNGAAAAAAGGNASAWGEVAASTQPAAPAPVPAAQSWMSVGNEDEVDPFAVLMSGATGRAPKRDPNQPKNPEPVATLGMSSRELNPHWATGNSGVPPTKEEAAAKAASSAKAGGWRAKLLAKKAGASGGGAAAPSSASAAAAAARRKVVESRARGKSSSSSSRSTDSGPRMARPSHSSGWGGGSSSGGGRSNAGAFDEHVDDANESWGGSRLEQMAAAAPGARSRARSASPSSGSASSSSDSGSEGEGSDVDAEALDANLMSAKILKAELMGDDDDVAALKQRIEKAKAKQAGSGGGKGKGKSKSRESRRQRGGRDSPGRVADGADADAGAGTGLSKEPIEEVLMAQGRNGMIMPARGAAVERDRQALSGKVRRVREKADTHDGGGNRARYFADDDDRGDIAAMVQREKMGADDDPEQIFHQLSSKFMGATDAEDYTMDDMFVDRAGRKAAHGKLENRGRQKAENAHKRMSQTMDNDPLSYANFSKNNKHLLLSLGDKVFMALPPRGAMCDDHVLLIPVNHAVSLTALDEDVWDELQQFKQCLVKMWKAQDKDVVFMETVMNVKKGRQTALHCIALGPEEGGDIAPMVFKKAIQECDEQWSTHQKVIDTRAKGLRRSIPKGFDYFAVGFEMEGGFGHVIEDPAKFPHYFGMEILGNMLGTPPNAWLNPKRERFENQKRKVTRFCKAWVDYDWTEMLDM